MLERLTDSYPDPAVAGLFSSPVVLSALLEPLPLGVVIVDSERRILLMNQALEALTGFTRDEVRGLPCWAVLRSNVCMHQCPVLEAEAGGPPIRREGDLINRAREKVSVRLTSVPVRDRQGVLVGFLETFEDIRLLQQLNEKFHQPYSFGQLIGRSPKMEELFRILPVLAQTDSSVLITGETGTGKDVVAEALHQASGRAKEPFIKVNCGALPETLLESELFGHTKGAFTGAVGDKPGRIRLAHNGTLYLTEIGDLPLSLQVKLLTFLDDKIVYPLGGAKGFQADVRVVAATHRNLERMVREGRFREDLLFRLNVVRLYLPPLRERSEDLPLLMDHFLAAFSLRFQKRVRDFSQEVRRILQTYPYPGNVRELRNIVEYAANICQEEVIRPEHLPVYIFEAPASPEKALPQPEETFPSSLSEVGSGTSGMNWSEIERRLIVEALVRSKGRKSRAAEILGWGRSTLWRKMKQYELDS